MSAGRRSRLLALAALCGLLPGLWSAAGAQDAAQVEMPPDALDLTALLRLARGGNPRLAAERQGIAVAEAERVTASALPNPTVNYGRFRPGGGAATVFDGSRQQQYGVEIPIPIGGQRSARIEAADRGIDAARARTAAGAGSLAVDAGAAFIELLAAQEQARLLEGAREELARQRAIIAGREASGMASRYDVARIEVEMGSAQARLDEARARVADRAGSLAGLLGIPGWRPRALGALAPLEIDPAELAGARAQASGSPAVLAAIREEEAARAAVEVARRERVPVPALNVGRTWTSEPFGAANFVGMSVEVPLFDTRRGPLAKAEAQAHQASLRRRLAEAETGASLERLAEVIAFRRSSLDHFDRESAAHIPRLKQMAEDAYRLGRGSILELLDAVRSRQELQRTRVELVAALLDAQLRFLALSGRLDRRLEDAGPENHLTTAP